MKGNEFVQIRLVRRPNFTGKFGIYDFKDGVSEPMVRREAERLAAITGVEFVGTLNMWERKAEARGIQPVQPVAPTAAPPVVAAVVPETGTPSYTRNELEQVADKSGIAGLREIAGPLGVSAVSIVAMINAILKAQEPKKRGA